MRRFLDITIPRPWVRGLLWAGLVLFCAALVGTLVGVDRLSRDLPSLDSLQAIDPSVKTVIFAANGDTLREFYTENRTIVPLSRIPRRPAGGRDRGGGPALLPALRHGPAPPGGRRSGST